MNANVFQPFSQNTVWDVCCACVNIYPDAQGSSLHVFQYLMISVHLRSFAE